MSPPCRPPADTGSSTLSPNDHLPRHHGQKTKRKLATWKLPETWACCNLTTYTITGRKASESARPAPQQLLITSCVFPSSGRMFTKPHFRITTRPPPCAAPQHSPGEGTVCPARTVRHRVNETKPESRLQTPRRLLVKQRAPDAGEDMGGTGRLAAPAACQGAPDQRRQRAGAPGQRCWIPRGVHRRPRGPTRGHEWVTGPYLTNRPLTSTSTLCPQAPPGKPHPKL